MSHVSCLMSHVSRLLIIISFLLDKTEHRCWCEICLTHWCSVLCSWFENLRVIRSLLVIQYRVVFFKTNILYQLGNKSEQQTWISLFTDSQWETSALITSWRFQFQTFSLLLSQPAPMSPLLAAASSGLKLSNEHQLFDPKFNDF